MPGDRAGIDFDPHAGRFVAHYDSIRGQVRLRLLHEQVADHLDHNSRVLDVGGGAGHLARLLALDGHLVVVAEPSAPMREHSGDLLADVSDRVQVVAAAADQLADLDRHGTFDAVLCHAVAPYVDDLAVLVADVAAAAAVGGVVSVVVKNRDALAMRPALEGRWAQVPAAFDAEGDAGGLGVRNRAHTLAATTAALAEAGCQRVAWYGVRVFSDALSADAEVDLDAVLAAERIAATRDPYRALGRLLHVVARRTG